MKKGIAGVKKEVYSGNTYKHIVKRDGKKVPFNQDKITNAIAQAGLVTGEFKHDVAENVTKDVLVRAEDELKTEVPTVEQIQNIVEEELMSGPYSETAKAYILYREQHKKLREMEAVAHVDIVDSYLKKLDWQVKENSNMGYSLQGLNNYIFSEVSKVYWLNKVYPNEIRKVHENGDMHIHDLGTLSIYCVGWDLQDLLREGFSGVKEKVNSKPAKHFRTALGQVVNFMYTLQGEAAGAIAFSNFDTLLAPFIRYDKLTQGEVEQAIQEFVFNMNVPTRVGFQTPFSNITLDLTPSPNFKDMNVIIGGEEKEESYADFQEEMNMLNTAFFKVMGEGDASGRVFTFPIPTVNVTSDFEWDNPNLAGLWEITAKYGIPYFSNFINSDMKPEDTRSMCCRLRLDLDELDKRGGGLFGANALTGSVGVVTINLPRLAYQSEGDKEKFYQSLDHMMDLAKESLEIKRKVLEKLTDKDLYPYSKFYLRNIKNMHGAYWANHFSTIGLVGLNEAASNLIGVGIGEEDGHLFAEEVLDHMRERLVRFQKETGDLFNLEATPAEGTAYRLALKDKKAMPDIKVANESEHKKGAQPFYTNSSHLPVNYTNDIFEALDLQDSLQTKYTGGTVMHLFLGERIQDPQIVPQIVKRICEKYKLPYFTLTPTFSVCKSHGYISGEHKKCPSCDKECEVYSRVVGYLRPVSQWNDGKQEEFEEREVYDEDDMLNH